VKQSAPAAARNRDPIAAVLGQVLPQSGVVLELASGTGEHVVHFARLFPHLEWQPTDPDPDALASIRAWSAEADHPNLREPMVLDAAAIAWPIERADAVLCINLVHISPWQATLGLLAGAARLLPTGAPLILYGPYREAQVPTAPSNEAFDASLRARNPEWGLRLAEDVMAVAAEQGLHFECRFEMPANNLTLVFRRT
jgi:SAM-dependent methyltransferase